jgi:hypothetical protein
MENYSLVRILQNDPDFARALAKKKEAVKKDKQNLLDAAKLYTKKYQTEILEGTKQRQKLLTDGKKRGLTEEEVFQGNTTFYPTIYTPILNFLYFMLREEEIKQTTKTAEEVLKDYLEEFGFEISDETKLYIKGILHSLAIEQKLDELGDSVSFEDVITDDVTIEPEEIGKFIYGSLTTDEFKKIKKLKALSRSGNEKEAFLAYRKALALCKKYNLEFDKIPCDVKQNLEQ